MIKLEDGWVIQVEGTIYVLKKFVKTKTDKSGKEIDVYSNALYYGTLKQAVLGWIRVATAECLSDKVLSLPDALKCVTDRLDHIEKMLNEVLKENE